MSRAMHGLLTAMLSVGSGLLLWVLLVDVGERLLDALGVGQSELASLAVWALAAIAAFGTAAFFIARWRATRSPVMPAFVGYVLCAATWIIFESDAQSGLAASILLLMNSVVVLIAARLGAAALTAPDHCASCGHRLLAAQSRCPECGHRASGTGRISI